MNKQDLPQIRLNDEEYELTEWVGNRRFERSRARGAVPKVQANIPQDIYGARGELSVAKWLPAYWSGMAHQENGKHVPDVGYCIEVRASQKGRLYVKPEDDPEAPWVFVRAEDSNHRVWTIVGWRFGKAAQQQQYWRPDMPRACYVLPIRDLLHPNALREWWLYRMCEEDYPHVLATRPAQTSFEF